jgi:hypothetical protein
MSVIDPSNPGFSPQRVMAAAIVGGTVSDLTGDKFASGALTAAFAEAFSGVTRARRSAVKRTQEASRAYRNGLPEPDGANPAELAFVRSVADQFDNSSYESCGLVCYGGDVDVGPPHYTLSEVHTDGAHAGCDPAGLSCGAGTTAVSDIHGHPRAGSYVMNRADAQFIEGGRIGMPFRVTNPSSFSNADMSYNINNRINGWVVPSGAGTILYFPHTMRYPVHHEYGRSP